MSAFDSKSTSLPGGFTNAAPWQTMAKAGSPDPTWAQQYNHEFNTFAAGDFTNSLVNSGAPALTATLGPGGVLLLTTTAGAADQVQIQGTVPSYQLTPGKHLFFKARFICSSVLNAAITMGLAVTAAAAQAATDGLMIYKAAGANTFVLRSVVGNVVTDTPFPASAVAADATWIEVGFHVDPAGNVEAFFNPTTGASALPAAGGFRGRVASVAPALTQALLAPVAQLLNGAAAARTLGLDFLTVSAER